VRWWLRFSMGGTIVRRVTRRVYCLPICGYTLVASTQSDIDLVLCIFTITLFVVRELDVFCFLLFVRSLARHHSSLSSSINTYSGERASRRLPTRRSRREFHPTHHNPWSTNISCATRCNTQWRDASSSMSGEYPPPTTPARGTPAPITVSKTMRSRRYNPSTVMHK